MNLKDEILAGESYSLEFKLVPNEDRIKYLKTVVAFANGRGGRILFGVANDMTVRGIAHDQVFAEMDGIVKSIMNGCSPRVPIDVGIENIDGKSVIAVRMNVYRNNALDSEVVKFGKSAEKHAGDGVNEGVSNVYEEIRRNPGIRTPSLVKAVGGSQASIERAIAKLKRLQKIVYRGAPKTGGYYCI